MEPLNNGFYASRFWLMTFISFFKWFTLGFLLNFMSDIKKLKLKVDIIFLSVGLACLAICLLVRLTLFVPVPMIIYGQGNFMVQLFCLAPIFPGFFMFEGLFSSEASS
nr:hypothetical protein [uncultured Acetobacterium sp.]